MAAIIGIERERMDLCCGVAEAAETEREGGSRGGEPAKDNAKQS